MDATAAAECAGREAARAGAAFQAARGKAAEAATAKMSSKEVNHEVDQAAAGTGPTLGAPEGSAAGLVGGHQAPPQHADVNLRRQLAVAGVLGGVEGTCATLSVLANRARAPDCCLH